MNHYFLTILSNAINTYLQLDPESTRRLHALENKVITIELLPLHFIFQIEFKHNKLYLHPGVHLNAQAKITGTPLQLLPMLLNKETRHTFFAEDIRIEGDAALAQTIILLFDELHIDYEEHLSHYTGDVPAYHLAKFTKEMKTAFTQAKQSFTQNVIEYLHEESGWLPTKEALQDFFDDIDHLRMDIDRIEARINELIRGQQ